MSITAANFRAPLMRVCADPVIGARMDLARWADRDCFFLSVARKLSLQTPRFGVEFGKPFGAKALQF